MEATNMPFRVKTTEEQKAIIHSIVISQGCVGRRLKKQRKILNWIDCISKKRFRSVEKNYRDVEIIDTQYHCLRGKV
jgi:hypothetical protein